MGIRQELETHAARDHGSDTNVRVGKGFSNIMHKFVFHWIAWTVKDHH